MTTALHRCPKPASPNAARSSTHRIRHLPVVDGNGLHGLISIGDLLAPRVREQDDTIRFLNDYMFNSR
jgi:hypothetical protein